jgi:toxin ParE1/3/4
VTRFVLAPAAIQDLDDIWLHIAQDDVEAAERVLAELESACELLASRPGIGHLREDLADTGVRFWSVHTYLIVYRPDRMPIEIVRFWHRARGVPNLL